MIAILAMSLSAHAAIPVAERDALVALYNATNGAGWTHSTNWLGDVGTECTWYGVTCDSGETHVSVLSLASNNLAGTIPIELGNLTNLSGLDLQNNRLTGAIPTQLGNLTNLWNLVLSSNQLNGTIPSELGNLTNLRWISLESNKLTGTIPSELANLTNLQHFSLWSNQLTGSIPPQLGSLNSLQGLGLWNNHLTGSIPAELGSLTSLQNLDLSGNQLNGSIPPELGSLASLQTLALEFNQLSGNIPPELGSLTSLQDLNLAANQLSGSIPVELGRLTSLRELWLLNNQLSGSIPPELGTLKNLQRLSVNLNQVSGGIPLELGSLTTLQLLDLGNNRLSGSIPSQLRSLANLQDLELWGNQLGGSIPAELGSLTSLTRLALAGNQLTGSIPAELGNLNGLQTLYLNDNQLSSGIPPELGRLTSLNELDLDNNHLSGTIPSELESLTSLRSLVVSRNQLSGSIPTQLGNLTNLRFLYLNGNELSGSVPSSLMNLIHLAQGDFRWNALYSTDPALTAFLTAKQGGSWQSTQTIAPTNPNISGVSDSSITVSWIPIAYTADNGSYQVSYSTTAGGPYTPFGPTTSTKSDSSLAVTGLTTNTMYYFVVNTTTQPHNNNFNTVTSGFSAEVSGTASASSPWVGVFTATPSTITAGESSTLSWTTTNATTVSISGVTESQSANGSIAVSPTVTTTYTLTATGSGGTASATTTIVVNPAAAPVVVSFTATPSTIAAGQPSTLSWTTTDTTSVSIDNGIGAEGLSGSIVVSPTTTTTYELTAAGPGGSTVVETTIMVVGPLSRLQLLLPGEIAVPGAAMGKAGTPTAQLEGAPFAVVVNGVDSSFNIVTTATDTIALAASESGSTLPPNAPLVAGSGNFTVTLPASPGQTITASDVTDPNILSSTSPQIAVTAANAPAVAVASLPSGLVSEAGTGGASDSYALTNTGGASTTITLSQSGNFFTQSPTTFALNPGETKQITLSSFAEPAGVYEGEAIPRGDGVPTGLTVPVRLLLATPLAGTVGATPAESRTEVSAPVGTNPTGSVAFMNSGTVTLLGILISDSPWLIPDPGVISIPPGETVSISFTIDTSLLPGGGTPGSTTAKLTLVFVAPTGASALQGRIASSNSTPQLGKVSVNVVDIAKPHVAAGTIPALGVGEVALLAGGLRHGNGVETDLAIVNTGLPPLSNDLKLYYVSPSASQTSPFGQLAPNISVSLVDVTRSVFGHDGETGGVQLRSTSIELLSVSAMRLNTSSPLGTYASALPVFRSDRSIAAGDTIFLAGLKKENGLHTNVSLQEAAGSAGSVKIDFLDAHGTAIGTRSQTLPPFGFLEIADAAPAGAMAARITNLGPSPSRIVAYGLAIDESTGDSWSLVDWNSFYGASATDTVVVPVVGVGAGAGVQTDLALVNKTSAANLVTLKYTTSGSSRRRIVRPSGLSFAPPAPSIIERTSTITLDPLGSTTITDLLSSRFFLASDSTGYLTITPSAGVAITARTYKSSHSGTSGTGIAAIPVSSMLIAGQVKNFGGIEDASSASVAGGTPATYRTNLGLIETAGQAANVRVTLRYCFPAGLVVTGHAENTKDFALSAGQFLLVTDVMTAIIGEARSSFGDLHNVLIEVRVMDGNGRVLPFIQSIDNGTGDTVVRSD